MVGVLMPREDLTAYMSAQNGRILLLLFTLFLLSAAAAYIFSRRYIAPVAEAIRSIKGQSAAAHEKTNIQEIDDLLLPYQMDLSRLADIEDGPLRDHIDRAGRLLWAPSEAPSC